MLPRHRQVKGYRRGNFRRAYFPESPSIARLKLEVISPRPVEVRDSDAERASVPKPRASSVHLWPMLGRNMGHNCTLTR